VTGTPRTVVVVGGGIAGLATAFALQEQTRASGLSLVCTVADADRILGGKIRTSRANDLVIEAGPDSFLSHKPWGVRVCEKLGLADQLINMNETGAKACVYSRGRLRELPEGLVVIAPGQIGSFVRSGLLSWKGLARMALDVVLPPRRAAGDESLADFFRRRFGREAFERVFEPLTAGIYAGDAEQMSVRATFPRFPELEQQYGSLIRGMLAARKTVQMGSPEPKHRRTMFVALRNGLGDLVTALSNRLQKDGVSLRVGARAVALRVRSREVGKWVYDVLFDDGTVLTADVVVLATPAYASAELVRPLSPSAAGLLERIPYASTATVSLAYDAGQSKGCAKGFGFVVPRVEGRNLIAATWTSLKWAHRAPPDTLLVRCYLGGVGREAIMQADDETIVRTACEELLAVTGLAAPPRYVEVHRWNRAMPQYTLGHLDRLKDIEMALSRFPGLFLTGAAYRGVGIPDCIKDGFTVAETAVRYLTGGESGLLV
jgi:oxygen-dependent protoporphyrinogen oxidase